MIATIARGTAAVTFGLLTAVAPLLSGPAQAMTTPRGPETAYHYEWNDGGPSDGPVYYHTYYCNGTTGVTACFDADGDDIFVKDTKADGFSAVMRWHTDYGRWGTCRNRLGSGTWALCNKNLQEASHTMTWRATRYNGNTGKWVAPESNDFTMNTAG